MSCSAILLMLKAFYDTVGRENAERITVEFSLSNALFCRAKGRSRRIRLCWKG